MAKMLPSLISWEILKSNLSDNSFIKTAAKKEKPESKYNKDGYLKVVIDRDGKEFNPRKGLEGPFLTRNKRAYYYSPKDGKWYCPYMDMYLEERPGTEGSKSASSLSAFKVSCKVASKKVDAIFFSKNIKQASSEFNKIASSSGLDPAKIGRKIVKIEKDLINEIKTAKYRHGTMSLSEAAEKVIDSTMTGSAEDFPSQDPTISQLISQLDVLVDTMSKVVGEDLSIQDVLDAFSDAAQSRGGSLQRQDEEDESSEMYVNFPKDKLLPPAPEKEAGSSNMLKEAAEKNKKSKSSSKRKPTNPSLWSRAKSEAKKKFDVYPSAYANLWASKWYKEKGGGWRKS